MPPSTRLSNHRHQQGGNAPKSASRVLKTLSPEQPGTMRLLRRYGDALVCVRYREDHQQAQRYTTVELIVDRRPFRPRGDPQVAVQIAYAEARLRQRAQELGAEWNPTKRAWLMPFSVAERLKLLDRIV